MSVAVSQVWRDNLTGEMLTIAEVIAPAREATVNHLVEVRYAGGHRAVYAASHFGQSGRLGFTRVEATTDQGIENQS